MLDGTILYADVYRPAGGGRHPVLLHRLPYGKHKPRYRAMYLDPIRAVNRGYAVVFQDVRGRLTSEGEFYPYVNEPKDGFDTVEWCAAQPWSDGNVGMFGLSYHGATQWLAAVERPPSLKAIVPGVTSDSYYDSWTYLGGAASGDAVDQHGMQLAWFDRWLKGEDNGVDTDPNTYIFVMGENVWRSEEAWPPPSARTETYFLRGEGRANTLNGDGRLSMDPPRSLESPDRYLYNPLDPVTTMGGAHLSGIPSVFETGVQDQRSLESRSDVLVYTSDPLERDTEVTAHSVSLT